ncbi:MAG: hypothetical protein M3M94_06820 [Actinomycetota bacterium]|nr:hypothetical protein [Actinomycetota bacterium]
MESAALRTPRDAAALNTVAEAATAVFIPNRERIDEILAGVRAVLDAHPTLYKWAGDTVTHIENRIERVVALWPQPVEAPVSEPDRFSALVVVLVHSQSAGPASVDVRDLKRMDALIDDAIEHIALLTTADRLNDHLRGVRIGEPLDFHETFADELDASQRKKILERLGNFPLGVDGIIDMERGEAYRVSPKWWKRIALGLVVPFLAVTAGGAVLALPSWNRMLAALEIDIGDKFATYPPVLGVYVLITLGALAHVLVSFAKRQRGTSREPIVVGSYVAWAYVRWASIVWSIVLVVAATVGYVAITNDLETTDAFTVFVLGYTVDSVADLFVRRFEAAVGARTGAIKKLLT